MWARRHTQPMASASPASAAAQVESDDGSPVLWEVREEWNAGERVLRTSFHWCVDAQAANARAVRTWREFVPCVALRDASKAAEKGIHDMHNIDGGETDPGYAHTSCASFRLGEATMHLRVEVKETDPFTLSLVELEHLLRSRGLRGGGGLQAQQARLSSYVKRCDTLCTRTGNEVKMSALSGVAAACETPARCQVMRDEKQNTAPSARASIQFWNEKDANSNTALHAAETTTVSIARDDAGNIEPTRHCGVSMSAHFDPEDRSWFAVRGGGERVAGPFELFCDIDDYLRAQYA